MYLFKSLFLVHNRSDTKLYFFSYSYDLVFLRIYIVICREVKIVLAILYSYFHLSLIELSHEKICL